MKEEIKSVFTCDFCKKKKLYVRGAMARHEFNCTYNPKNFSACSTCKHCEVIQFTITHDDGNFEWCVQQTRGFRCAKLNKGMYPFQAVKKGLLIKYPDQFKGQEQMPTKCELYENGNNETEELPW